MKDRTLWGALWKGTRMIGCVLDGGIWRARDGLSGSPRWEFVSGSFATNAIGSLIVDPNDGSGKTLYAGTGEPNVSIDSEAGMGIYKTTNGGDTWTQLAGSVQFRGRAVASIAVTPSGDILAAIARAVRGYSSVPGGAVSNPPPPVATFGVYKSSDGGAAFTNVFDVTAMSARGANEVRVDPNNGAVYYASVLQQGVWRSSNGGAAWTHVTSLVYTTAGTAHTLTLLRPLNWTTTSTLPGN